MSIAFEINATLFKTNCSEYFSYETYENGTKYGKLTVPVSDVRKSDVKAVFTFPGHLPSVREEIQ